MHEQTPEWDLADRMRKSLRHAGLGVQEMADYMGVSASSVSNWINGRIRPTKPTQRLWAMRTGVPFSWLAEGTAGGSRNQLTQCHAWELAA